MNDYKLRSKIKYYRRNFTDELEETVDFYLEKWGKK
jgi:hypothetical protein